MPQIIGFLVLLFLAVVVIGLIIKVVIFLVTYVVLPVALGALVVFLGIHLINGICWFIDEYQSRSTPRQRPSTGFHSDNSDGFISSGSRPSGGMRCRVTGLANCQDTCCRK